MKIDMKTSSIFIRTISILLVLTFITGQVSASQVLSARSSDTLAASLVTDSNINPARSKPLQGDIAGKVEPGAIGNGMPLMELAQGKLPPSVDHSEESGRRYFALKENLRKKIHLAISIVTENMHKVPPQHMPRVKLALQDLIYLENQTSVGVYLFLADIRGWEDYLLGFRTSLYRGLAADFIEWLDCKYTPDNMVLGARRIAQYIFHECVPEKGIITERDDHRVVYNEIQSAVFGKDEVLALKQDLREFINEKASQRRILLTDATTVFLDAFSGKNPKRVVGRAIERQEKRDQEELTRSEFLPIEGTSNEAEWSAIGVKLGEPKAGDPLFRHVTLPSGWKIVLTEHSMWSNLVDNEGTVRANIFYKAAFYDRRANVTLLQVEPKEKVVTRPSEGIREEKIGQFQTVLEAWNTIVDLYNGGKIGWVVYVPRDIYNTMPIEQQYDAAPGDIIAPRRANPIDHGGWAPIKVAKNSPHMTLMFTKDSVELFIDTHKDGSTVAKVVPVPATTTTPEQALEIAVLEQFPQLDTAAPNLLKGAVIILSDSEVQKLNPEVTVGLGIFGGVDITIRNPEFVRGQNPVTGSYEQINLYMGSGRQGGLIVKVSTPDDKSNRPNDIPTYSEKEQFLNAVREALALQKTTPTWSNWVEIASQKVTATTSASVQTPAVLMAQISEDLPVRAKVFASNLVQILAQHPDQLFFMGIETDIGESQKAQIMPIYKAIDQIENLTDSNGKRLFPNLMVRRGKAGELVAMASDLSKEGKLNLNNTFIGARKVSVDSKLYDSIKGEGRAWISAIDDSSIGDYIPVFEAITLNMMAYLNADITAIKNFYDAISDKPIDPGVLQDMIRNRIIYILPRATKFDTKQLRELYELARQVYIAA